MAIQWGTVVGNVIKNIISNNTIGVPVVLTTLSRLLWGGVSLIADSTETAPAWADEAPGNDPDNIGPYQKDENGEWWEVDGGNLDKVQNGVTIDLLDRVSETTKRMNENFDGDQDGIPDILKSKIDAATKSANDAAKAALAARRDPLIFDLDGDGYAQGQLDLSYPISDKIFGRTGTFLHFQLLGGYGETLIDYNRRSDTQLRVGISLAR